MAKKIQYDEFLAKAKKVWGDEFIYPTPDNFDYRKGTIEIICPSHGPFRRVPTNHVSSNKHRKPAGCPECFREADRKAKMKPFSTVPYPKAKSTQIRGAVSRVHIAATLCSV